MPPPTPSPPPAYETVAKLNEKQEYDIPEKFAIVNDGREDKIVLEDDDLPTYDDAMKLGAQGYL